MGLKKRLISLRMLSNREFKKYVKRQLVSVYIKCFANIGKQKIDNLVV